MSVYKIVSGSRGKRYMKDKKFIKEGKIPIDILAQLQTGKEVPDKAEGMHGARICIFCGMGCKMTRIVNGQMVYICEDHFYSTNVGQIAQQLRSLQEA